MSLRPAVSDADLEAYVRVWNVVDPAGATSVELQRLRRERDACTSSSRQTGDRWAAASRARRTRPTAGTRRPRVLPEARRRGHGSALLRALCDHLEGLGFGRANSRVDGRDEGSLVFARRFGFEETNRQVEQVRELGDESEVEPPAGVRFVSVAERPELLRAAHELGLQGWADMAVPMPVTISLEDWLEEEATLPGGSFVALAGNEIVGYSGLCRLPEDGVAGDGLTVVSREWRRRRLATALKRAELAWATRNGVRRVVTWTQHGNEAMRAVNERLGFRYGLVEIDVGRELPLEPL